MTEVYSVSGIDFSNLAFSSIPTSSNSIWDAATADRSATGYRLPIEMEWMWTAMGAIDDYTKPFAGSNGSNAIADYAWLNLNSGNHSHPVGTTGTMGYPNELGLYDMSGDVGEWNWDWYASSYPIGTIYSNTTVGRGADSGTCRVNRGGGWHNDAYFCSVSCRGCDSF